MRNPNSSYAIPAAMQELLEDREHRHDFLTGNTFRFDAA